MFCVYTRRAIENKRAAAERGTPCRRRPNRDGCQTDINSRATLSNARALGDSNCTVHTDGHAHQLSVFRVGQFKKKRNDSRCARHTSSVNTAGGAVVGAGVGGLERRMCMPRPACQSDRPAEPPPDPPLSLGAPSVRGVVDHASPSGAFYVRPGSPSRASTRHRAQARDTRSHLHHARTRLLWYVERGVFRRGRGYARTRAPPSDTARCDAWSLRAAVRASGAIGAACHVR